MARNEKSNAAVAELHRQAAADYGTPDERAAREQQLRETEPQIREHGQAAATAERGTR